MAFRLWRKKQPLALPAPQQAGDPLRADFAAARFGNYCRTLTLTFPYANVPVYRHALSLGPGRGWRVLEVIGQQPEAELPPRTSIQAEKLDFFSAIQHLAEWQEGQIKMGFGVDRVEAEKLGIAYFIPFGERENLAFDYVNQPHPTVGGEIATTGYFTDEARTRAKASAGLPAPPQTASGLFEIFLSRPAGQTQDIDALVAETNHHAGLHDLLGHLKELSTALTYIFEYKIFSTDSINRLSVQKHDFYTNAYCSSIGRGAFGYGKHNRFFYENMAHDENFGAYFERRLKEAKGWSDRLPLTPEAKAAHAEIFKAFEIVYHSLAAKYLTQYSQKDASSRLSPVYDASTHLKKAEQLFAEVVKSKGESFSVAAYAFNNDKLKVPSIISTLLKDFEQALDKAKKQSEENKKRLLALPHTPAPNPAPTPALPRPK